MKNKDKIWNGGDTFMRDRKRLDQINKNMDKPCEISGGNPINRYRKPEGDLVNGITTLDNRNK